MSKLEEWKSVSHMARFSWKLTTTQVADAADAAIAELEAALEERERILNALPERLRDHYEIVSVDIDGEDVEWDAEPALRILADLRARAE